MEKVKLIFSSDVHSRNACNQPSLCFDKETEPCMLSIVFSENMPKRPSYYKFLVHQSYSSEIFDKYFSIEREEELISDHGAVEFAFDFQSGYISYITMPIRPGMVSKIGNDGMVFKTKEDGGFACEKPFWDFAFGYFKNIRAIRDEIHLEIYKGNRAIAFYWGRRKLDALMGKTYSSKFSFLQDEDMSVVGFIASDVSCEILDDVLKFGR